MNWLPIIIGVVMACVLGADGSNSFFTCTDKVTIKLKKSESIISFTDIEKDTLFVAQTQASASKCSPKSVSATEAVFSFNFDECEPEVKDGATKISYTFTVWNEHYFDPAIPIKRSKTEFFKVTCTYAKELPATSPLKALLFDKSPYFSCTSSGVKFHLLATHFPTFKIAHGETDVLYVAKEEEINPAAECKPQTQTATEVILEFAYDKCGQVVEDTADYITYVYIFRNAGPPTYSRVNVFQKVACQFQKNVIMFATVGMQGPVKSPIGNSVGKSDMNMVVSIPEPPSNSPTSRSSAGHLAGGQTIMSGTRLHVDVKLPDEEKTSDFVVSLINCYATQSPNDNDEKKIEFIDNSCPADKDDMSPETLNVISNGEGKKSSFEFDSFEWKHLTTEQAQQLYITCLAEKCDETKAECKGTCEQQGRFRRSGSSSRNATDFLSAGPFYIGGKKTRSSTICSENSGCSDTCFLEPSTGKEMCICRSGRTLLSDYKTCADVYSKHSNLFDFGLIQLIFTVSILLGFTLTVVLLIKRVTRKESPEKIAILS